MSSPSLFDYSEFFRLKGHQVIQRGNLLWIDVRPSVFQIAPPFNFENIRLQEVDEVLKSRKALVCRWFSRSIDPSAEPANSQILYTARPPYDLTHLQQKARNQTRRGLERLQIRKAILDESTERLAFPVYADNVMRLGLLPNEDRMRSKWRSWVNAITKSRCAEFWTAWHDSALVAFTVAVQTDFGTELVMQRSAQAALSLYPNNALVYTVTRDAFQRGAKLVSFGLSSFAGEGEGLHRFKLGMNFKPEPLREHQRWHPLVRPFSSLMNPERVRSAYRNLSRVGLW